MNIAMLSTPFVSVPPRGYGGTELIVHELVEGLASKGHRVTLFATGDSVVTDRVTLRYAYDEAQWPPELLPDLYHISRAMEDIVQGDFDIVHCHSAAALAFHGLLEAPMVYTLHHPREATLSGFYEKFPGVHYVAISADQAGREVAQPSCRVIQHGLNPRRYDWQETATERLCFIGRFAPFKGLHTAIDVAAEVGRPIDVAGSVHEVDREYGEREVEQRLRLDHVDYLGVIGSDRKRPLLARAAALLFPISWHEPFGLVMIEAMLSGCPVVAFPCGSVPEIVEEGVTGFLVTSPEELAHTVRRGGPIDAFDRERCRRRAVERFGRMRMVRDHLELYEEVIESHPASRARGISERGRRAGRRAASRLAPVASATGE